MSARTIAIVALQGIHELAVQSGQAGILRLAVTALQALGADAPTPPDGPLPPTSRRAKSPAERSKEYRERLRKKTDPEPSASRIVTDDVTENVTNVTPNVTENVTVVTAVSPAPSSSPSSSGLLFSSSASRNHNDSLSVVSTGARDDAGPDPSRASRENSVTNEDEYGTFRVHKRVTRRRPETAAPTREQEIEWARVWHIPPEHPEFPKFLDTARAKGRTYNDWSAAWRNWLRNVPRFAPPPMPGPKGALRPVPAPLTPEDEAEQKRRKAEARRAYEQQELERLKAAGKGYG